MKIITKKDKITVRIIKEEDINNINDYIKRIILTLKRKYKIDIFGFYRVDVYQNSKVGLIIDIIKEEDIDCFNDLLDLKVNIKKNSPMYLKFNDYFLNEKKDIQIIDNSFYISVDNITKKEMLEMIEFSEIVYQI